MDPENALRLGRGRTVEEIALASGLNKEERLTVMTGLAERLSTAGLRPLGAAGENAGRP
jgi:hypothetical protein